MRNISLGCAVFVLAGFFGSFALADVEKGDAALRACDYETAYSEMLIDAENGNPKAQTGLAVMFWRGFWVEKDVGEAMKWAGKAAAQDYTGAQTLLGQIYYLAKGEYEDSEKGFLWTRVAAEKGDPNAQNNLGNILMDYYFIDEEIYWDEATAAVWYDKAAQQGHVISQVSLGSLYVFGDGVPENPEKALYWFKKAGEAGYAGAYDAIGEMYKFGSGFNEDHEEASKWYKKAADLGSADAMLSLGLMFAEGDGVKRDKEKAEKLLEQSALTGNNLAAGHLGFLFLGTVGTKDASKALFWLTIAGGGADPEGVLKEGLREDLSPEKVAEIEREVEDWKNQRKNQLKKCPN